MLGYICISRCWFYGSAVFHEKYSRVEASCCLLSSSSSWCLPASRVAYRPRQEEDGLLTKVGFGSGFGSAAPLQPDVPVVLLRAVSVVVILLVLLQEVTLVIEAWLRRGNKRGA